MRVELGEETLYARQEVVGSASMMMPFGSLLLGTRVNTLLLPPSSDTLCNVSANSGLSHTVCCGVGHMLRVCACVIVRKGRTHHPPVIPCSRPTCNTFLMIILYCSIVQHGAQAIAMHCTFQWYQACTECGVGYGIWGELQC